LAPKLWGWRTHISLRAPDVASPATSRKKSAQLFANCDEMKFSSKDQSRSARIGSVRVARHAGKKHAANDAMAITRNADPNASGSRGLTL
jgi:hypothetical protein